MNQRDWTAAPGNRPYECDPDNAVFLSTGRCPSDRTALSPAGDVSASFTNAEVPGLLEWVPWVDDDDDQSTPLKPLEPGLYNFVVVVTDADGATAQADFLVYLYDAPVHFCSGDCARARLAGPDGRGNFLPSTAGMPTFADLDGIYGRTEEEPLFNQRCAICGSGDNAGNGSVWCTPETNVGGTCAAHPDFDGDGAFRLADAVYVAEVWAGKRTWASAGGVGAAAMVCRQGDFDGDGMMRLADAVYAAEVWAGKKAFPTS